MATSAPPKIFDTARRNAVLDRAMQRAGGDDFFRQQMGEALLDRLSFVQRDFDDILLIGRSALLESELSAAKSLTVCAPNAHGLPDGGIHAPDDALPFAADSFDCVINVGLFDSCNDVPGAMLLARRCLRPDGLFMSAFVGGNSLPTLRDALIRAGGDRVAQRMHPMIDVRTAGDLLMRAGFALPVADVETINLDYSSPQRLFADLRDYGGSCVLADHNAPLSRAAYRQLMDQLGGSGADAKGFSEQLDILFLLGWKPHPNQPKPARRGSGTASLATALKPDSE